MARSSDGILGLVTSKKPDIGSKKYERKEKPSKEKSSKEVIPPSSDSVKDQSMVGTQIEHVEIDPDSIQEGDAVLALIDPERIVSWSHKDRTDAEVDDDPEFERLLKRIERSKGNYQAIKVRPIRANKKNDGPDFEEIWGFKRLRACRQLGLKVLAIVEPMSDEEAYRQMSAENDGRSDISAWSKALSWKNALTQHLMPSPAAIAEEEERTIESVESYLRVVDIMDQDIIDNVKLHKLGIQSLYEIRAALVDFESNPRKRQKFIDRVIEQADRIERGQATPKLFENIRNDITDPTVAEKKKPRTVSSSGAKLFTINPGKQGYSVKVHFAGMRDLEMSDLEEMLKKHLQDKGVKFDD